MTAIRPEWLMVKYPQIEEPSQLYVGLLTKYNERFPWKVIRKLKRVYHQEEGRERIHLLWQHYYQKQAVAPSTLTSMP